MQELQTSTMMTEQINKALSNGVTSDPAVWQGLLFVWFLLLFLCPLFCCVLVLLLEDIHTLSFIHIHSAKPVPGERAGVVCLCVCLLGLLDLNYEGHFNLYLMTASTRGVCAILWLWMHTLYTCLYRDCRGKRLQRLTVSLIVAVYFCLVRSVWRLAYSWCSQLVQHSWWSIEDSNRTSDFPGSELLSSNHSPWWTI